MARVAVIQLDPHLADPARNTALIERWIAEAGAVEAELAVFPECAVSGYVYASLDEALSVAEQIPGPSVERITESAARWGIYVVAGLLERAGARCYNSAVLCGPEGLLAVYRKTHTLCLGVDRFTTPGEGPLAVHDLPFGRIGILICYDLRFPETARVLALEGAQAIVLPTNWPVSSSIQADALTRARAAENRLFVLAANRVGVERGAQFLGRSQIIAPTGDLLAEASRTGSEMLVAEIDLGAADEKKVVVRPGEHEMDLFGDRRPDLYGRLVREAARVGGP